MTDQNFDLISLCKIHVFLKTDIVFLQQKTVPFFLDGSKPEEIPCTSTVFLFLCRKINSNKVTHLFLKTLAITFWSAEGISFARTYHSPVATFQNSIEHLRVVLSGGHQHHVC